MNPKQNISANRALDLIEEKGKINDSYIERSLVIEDKEFSNSVELTNCIVSYFSAAVSTFSKPVVLKNCHFKECVFTFSYFLDNLHIEDCTFDTYLDIQAGINRGSAVLINNTFKGFVNFFDRTFEGNIELVNNRFEEGTNILSEKQMITLPDNLVQKNNTGEMMCEYE